MAKDKKDRKPYTVASDLAEDPVNLTKDGRCSRCGGCCSSVLPLGQADIDRLKAFVTETGFRPKMPDGKDVVYMHCPFMTGDPDKGPTACAAYDARPDVCRVFICSNTNAANAKAWVDAYGEKPLPEPKNAWLVFNGTGLRINGVEIPYDRAPLCRIGTDRHEAYEFHVGRPASFLLENGDYVPPAIVVAIYRNGLHIFNGAKRAMDFVAFGDIAKVLSEDCAVPYMEDEKPGRGPVNGGG